MVGRTFVPNKHLAKRGQLDNLFIFAPSFGIFPTPSVSESRGRADSNGSIKVPEPSSILKIKVGKSSYESMYFLWAVLGFSVFFLLVHWKVKISEVLPCQKENKQKQTAPPLKEKSGSRVE